MTIKTAIPVDEFLDARGKVGRRDDMALHAGNEIIISDISYDPYSRQKMVSYYKGSRKVTAPATQIVVLSGRNNKPRLASKVASRYISKRADHHHGSYMSLQNVHEMYTFLDSIDNMIGHEENLKELDDWVEDKISHAHAILQDLHRYFSYGRGYDSDALESAEDYHELNEGKFKF